MAVDIKKLFADRMLREAKEKAATKEEEKSTTEAKDKPDPEKGTKKPTPTQKPAKEAPKAKEKVPSTKKSSKPDAGKGVEIKDKVQVNFDPIFNEKNIKSDKEDDKGDGQYDSNLDEVAFLFDYDMSVDFNNLDEEVKVIIDECLNEVLSISSRIKKKQTLRRYRSRVTIARKRAMRRRASTSSIQKRARRSAINTYKRKFATKKTGTLSYAERGRVERLVKQRKGAVNNTSRRLVRVKRQQERARLSRRR